MFELIYGIYRQAFADLVGTVGYIETALGIGGGLIGIACVLDALSGQKQLDWATGIRLQAGIVAFGCIAADTAQTFGAKWGPAVFTLMLATALLVATARILIVGIGDWRHAAAELSGLAGAVVVANAVAFLLLLILVGPLLQRGVSGVGRAVVPSPTPMPHPGGHACTCGQWVPYGWFNCPHCRAGARHVTQEEFQGR